MNRCLPSIQKKGKNPKKERAEKRRVAFLTNLVQAIETDKAICAALVAQRLSPHFGAYTGFKSLLERRINALPPIQLEDGKEWKNIHILKTLS